MSRLKRLRTTTLAIALGVLVTAALLTYGASTGTVTRAAQVATAKKKPATHKKLTRAQKLHAALKACKKKKPKSARKKCERTAHRLYGPPQSKQKHGEGKSKEREKTKETEKEIEKTEKVEKTEETTTQKPTKAEVTAGKTIFESECKVCHGAKGGGKTEGGTAPPYSELPRADSVQGVVEQLTTPETSKGYMPSFPKLSTAEKEAVGAYVAVELTHKVEAH